MPELPEVETVKNHLKKLVLNEIIDKIEILDPKIPSYSNISLNNLSQQKILDIERKGKYLLFIFEKYILISHLRMEGKYYLYNEDEDNSRFARVIFHFKSAKKLIYDDSRRFGTMELILKEDKEKNKTLSKIAKEPFMFSDEEFYNVIHGQKTNIKNALLDQSLVAGIGNIYCDEILYTSEVSPFYKSNKLTFEQTSTILKNSKIILNKAIEMGGSTIKSYHPGRDINGMFQQMLSVYSKAGAICLKCNSKIIKTTRYSRGTSYCPSCQKVAKVIGIYGKIASGKTTLLNYIKQKGYSTFSSDEEVNLIYKNDEKFALYMKSIHPELQLDSNNKLTKKEVKKHFNESIKLDLEKYIHPKIKEKALKFINLHINEKLIFLEIPLIFESKMDYICDYIIGVDIDYQKQIEHLKNRNSSNISQDLLINSSNQFDKYVKQCDDILLNNKKIDDFYLSINELLKDLENR